MQDIMVYLSKDEAQPLNKIAPYSKILYLTAKQNDTNKWLYKRNGKQKIITVYLSDNVDFSVENICQLFNAPEDVRAIVTDQPSLLDLAKYFSLIRNVPAVFMGNQIVNGLFCGSVFVKNGDVIDQVFTRGVSNLILTSAPSVLSICESALIYPVCLIDLCMRNLLTGKGITQSDLRLNQMIISTLNAIILNDTEKAMRCILDIEKNLSLNQTLLTCCAPYIAFKVIKRERGAKLIDFVDFAVKYYTLTLDGKVDSCEDYIRRAKDLAFISGTSVLSCEKRVKKQLSSLSRNNIDVSYIKAQVCPIIKTYNKLLSEYKRLGGKIKKITGDFACAVKLSGDTAFGVNGATVCREINMNKV